MASLTPLSKTLIGLAVVGAMASAAWHLVLKERFSGAATTSAPSTPPPEAVVLPGPAAETAQEAVAPGAPAGAEQEAELGRQLLAAGDFAKARLHLEKAVQGGDGAAACHLGEMTLKGEGGLVANQEAAAKLFQLAQSRNIICFAPGQ